MDPLTGEIIWNPTAKDFAERDLVELRNEPKKDCSLCHGRGHDGIPRKVGKGRRARLEYRPCECCAMGEGK